MTSESPDLSSFQAKCHRERARYELEMKLGGLSGTESKAVLACCTHAGAIGWISGQVNVSIHIYICIYVHAHTCGAQIYAEGHCLVLALF